MRSILFLVFIILTSCKSATVSDGTNVKAEVDTLYQEKISIRAILVDNNRLLFGADKGRFGIVDLISGKTEIRVLANDSVAPEFRSIASNGTDVFILNAGSPATLIKIGTSQNESKVVYSDTNKKIFYDSMRFWDRDNGLAIGDPVKNCMSFLLTRDGGKTWNSIPCDNLPLVTEGEAAFAASNTNIVTKGKKAWIFTGGKRSRMLFSADRGKTWSQSETPIIQGEAMTGIFTADFYDEKIGFISGGNYEKPNEKFSNKAITIDGGKSWQLIADGSGFGYASCVQFVPGANGRELLSVGASGLQYSADMGKTWKQLLTDSSLYTIRFASRTIAYAAGKNKIIRIRFKKP